MDGFIIFILVVFAIVVVVVSIATIQAGLKQKRQQSLYNPRIEVTPPTPAVNSSNFQPNFPSYQINPSAPHYQNYQQYNEELETTVTPSVSQHSSAVDQNDFPPPYNPFFNPTQVSTSSSGEKF